MTDHDPKFTESWESTCSQVALPVAGLTAGEGDQNSETKGSPLCQCWAGVGGPAGPQQGFNESNYCSRSRREMPPGQAEPTLRQPSGETRARQH